MTTTNFQKEEIQKLRAETRGTAQRVHFNNAGCSLPADPILKTVNDYLEEEATFGGYETEAKHQHRINEVYDHVARLINASPGEIALMENASVAWGTAFNGIAFQDGDEIIISEMEYITNFLGFLQIKNKTAVKINVAGLDENGNLSLDKLEAMITPKTRLIAATHVASSSGAVLPVIEIGKIAAKHKILYLLDACQSVGQLPVDVRAIQCDMLAATGRKYLRAPRGTGFLYVRKEVQDQITPMIMDGFSTTSVNKEGYSMKPTAARYELYEKNRALTLGLGRAAQYVSEIGIERIAKRIQELAAMLREKLSQINGITVHDHGDQLCGIVTFTFLNQEPVAIKTLLANHQINVSLGPFGSTLLYMSKHNLTTVIRASIHYYNTEEEIKLMCDVLQTVNL